MAKKKKKTSVRKKNSGLPLPPIGKWIRASLIRFRKEGNRLVADIAK